MASAADARRDRGTSLTLLERLRGNEQAAWHTTVHLYMPLVAHWCARAGVKGADADDVIQEVFRAAAASLPNFRRDRPGDTFRGWLRGITRHALAPIFATPRVTCRPAEAPTCWSASTPSPIPCRPLLPTTVPTNRPPASFTAGRCN
jgi:DNA-directed RNA polymerase specialized sigma24 family protein